MLVVDKQEDLLPIIRAAVTETVQQMEAERAKLTDRLAYTEPEAAALLGLPKHVLRDARLRGDVAASRPAKRILYRREDLLAWLEKFRLN